MGRALRHLAWAVIIDLNYLLVKNENELVAVAEFWGTTYL